VRTFRCGDIMIKLDDLPLLEALQAAAENGWSGLIQVISGDVHAGNVLMHQGRVAWVVCKDHREDLGSYLQRYGRLTDAQIQEARHRYESLGKTKRLGTVLLEEGMIDRDSLANCLRQHLSETMRALLELPSPGVVPHEGNLAEDEEFSFSIDEVLEKKESGSEAHPGSVEDWLQRAESQLCLKELRDVPGYRGALIAAAGGRVLWSHGLEPQRDFPGGLVDVPATWLTSNHATAANSALGSVEFSCIECSEGILAAIWLDEGEGVFFAVRLEKGGNLGITKHKLAAARGMIARQAAAKTAASE